MKARFPFSTGLDDSTITSCKHEGTPFSAKAVAGIVVAYALSPIGPIPDFIPVIGFLDELIVLPGLIWLAIKLIPALILSECRQQADAWMTTYGKKPRTKWGILIAVLTWIVLLTLLSLGYCTCWAIGA